MGATGGGEEDRARELQHTMAMTEFDPLVPATANGNEQRPPEAAIDALIEIAWGFPGYRVSFAAFDGPRALRFCTSAGEEQMAQLEGLRIDLTKAPRLLEAIRTAHVPVAIEDVETDSRARPVAEAFKEIEARAILILPLRQDRDPQPFGAVVLDRAKPRTWGLKESAALDRLAPIIALSLQHVRVMAQLESTRASAADYERRVRAMEGMIGGFSADAQRLARALTQTVDRSNAGAVSLADQLVRLVDELDGVPHGPLVSTPAELVSLPEMATELAHGLEAITGLEIDVQIDGHESSLRACVQRAGLERLVTKLVLHACRDATTGSKMTIEVRAGGNELPTLALHGEAVAIDDALCRVATGNEVVAADQLAADLWQARGEALMQGIVLHVREAAVEIRIPSAEACAPRSAGGV